jgi:hypothetical protein
MAHVVSATRGGISAADNATTPPTIAHVVSQSPKPLLLTRELVQDYPNDERPIKILRVIDEYSRECLSIVVERSL